MPPGNEMNSSFILTISLVSIDSKRITTRAKNIPTDTSLFSHDKNKIHLTLVLLLLESALHYTSLFPYPRAQLWHNGNYLPPFVIRALLLFARYRCHPLVKESAWQKTKSVAYVRVPDWGRMTPVSAAGPHVGRRYARVKFLPASLDKKLPTQW